MNYLLVDDQDDIIDIVSLAVQDMLQVANLYTAHSSVEAIEILKTKQIDVCICDHNMPEGNGNFVLQYIKDNNINIKFILCSTVTPEDEPLFYPRQYILMNIQKPDIFAGIEKLASLLKKNPTPDQFIPISLKCLLLIEKTPADIYLKLNDDKFIKCLNKNIDFLNEDFSKYTQKEVKQLFVKANELDFSKDGPMYSAINKIFNKPHVSMSEKIGLAHDTMYNMIQETGINTVNKEVILEVVSQSIKTLQSSNVFEKYLLKMELFGEYPSQLYTLHSILAHTIARKCNWSTQQTLAKLNLSCFLQSINHCSLRLMKYMTYDDFVNDSEILSKEEKESFLNSPEKTKQIIEEFHQIPNDLAKLIQEQYEAPDGTGFPRKLTANQINTISAVFILSGIFARYILNNRDNYSFDIFIVILERKGYSKGNFKEPFKYLKEIIESNIQKAS